MYLDVYLHLDFLLKSKAKCLDFSAELLIPSSILHNAKPFLTACLTCNERSAVKGIF